MKPKSLRSLRKDAAKQFAVMVRAYQRDLEIIEAMEAVGFEMLHVSDRPKFGACGLYLSHWAGATEMFFLCEPISEAEAEFYVYQLQEVFRVCPHLHTVDDWRAELVCVLNLAGHKVDFRITVPTSKSTCQIEYEDVVIPAKTERRIVGVNCSEDLANAV